jgi:hypothetical protein
MTRGGWWWNELLGAGSNRGYALWIIDLSLEAQSPVGSERLRSSQCFHG